MPNRATCFLPEEEFAKMKAVYARFNDPWTKDEVEELKEMTAASVPLQDIAAHLQRTPNSLKLKLQGLGLLVKNPAAKPWTPEDDDALVKLYNDGAAFPAMAEHFARSERAVIARLVKLRADLFAT
ncbi:MAG: hypothetical protein J6T02_01655 [Bacteroidales bacterium]|nr:hypothetical protein [Bacteroidales bacterium]